MYYLCSENKGADSFAVTAKLICAFFFAYADCWFSHEAAHVLVRSLVAAVAKFSVKLSVANKAN